MTADVLAAPPRQRPRRRRAWRVPTGLLLLSLIPIVAGSVRMTELASQAAVTPDNARFFADPVPVVLHIVGATLFSVLGAFQFVPSLRRRAWHRRAGRVALPAGLVAAATGIWMAVLYPLPYPNTTALDVVRVVFGVAMFAALVLALRAILRRDVRRHRAWMTRGYAIGLGAGTQGVLGLPVFLLVGEPGEVWYFAILRGGWLINGAVAEWVIRGRPALLGSRARA